MPSAAVLLSALSGVCETMKPRCLRDDETALFALLCIPEFTDYMPINPNLSDIEIAEMVRSSGADCALVSKEFLDGKSALFQSIHMLDWDAIVAGAWQAMDAKTPQNQTGTSDAEGRLILHTSGSTGLPKRVPIRMDAINASAKNIAKGHDLSSHDHALNALPTFHIGALVDVLLAPWSAGGSVSITHHRAPMQLAQQIIAKRPTWIQIVPTILRRMVEDLEPDVLRDVGAPLRFIRSISAPVPADLKQIAEERFGCPVVEMYGMTETAGQIATNSCDRALTKPGSVGRPVGVDVAILDGFGNRVETGKTGEVCVCGPTVFEGYEGMAKDAVFFDDWFRTGDLGMLDPEGYLFLQGRLKEMINVGGEKVSPYEVETAALRLPDVIEAAAYALPHPTLGEHVGLTVATRTAGQIEPIKAFLKTQLVDFKCPNAIIECDQLPRLANAKVDRVLLKREGAQAWADRTASHTGSRTGALTGSLTGAGQAAQLSPLARTVSAQWVRCLKCRPPVGQDDFFDMGGDSLSATQFLLGLEKALKRDISPNQLFEYPTFSGLVASLSASTQTPAQAEDRAIRFVRQNMAGWPGRTMLAGGLMHGMSSMKSAAPLFWSCQDSAEIQAISETIGRDRPLYFVGSLFKFTNRTSTDFEALADQLAMEIDTLQPGGPISLGGFCGGAHVMLYVAERLQDMGRDIRVLVSFDFWPDRVAGCPVIHGMSKCRTNSVRMRYPRFELALDALHPRGSRTFEIDSDHRFNFDDLRPYLAQLNGAIEGTAPIPEPAEKAAGFCDFAARHQVPEARIDLQAAPRFYTRGGRARVNAVITNTSEQVWEKTADSGLSLQIDLVNLDGHTRVFGAGYADFKQPVAPDDKAEVTVELLFPSTRIPLWMSCALVSQGVARFDAKSSGARRRLILPRLLRGGLAAT